jgi:hypothetical protein
MPVESKETKPRRSAGRTLSDRFVAGEKAERSGGAHAWFFERADRKTAFDCGRGEADLELCGLRPDAQRPYVRSE